MPRCCGGAGCSCVIVPGVHIQVNGTGTGNDPYTIIGDVGLAVGTGTQIQLALAGNGTDALPWVLTADYAATATLDGLPDVNAPAPTNAQVLGWDSATSKWTPRAPTTAASGSVQTGTGLSGDGSAGTPLLVRHDPNRFTATQTGGIGLTDAGINSLVRHFPDSAARSAASPAPVLNTLAMLDTAPGQVEYYTGSGWSSVRMPVNATGQLLNISGAYTSQPVTLMVRQISLTSDAAGLVELLSVADLTLRAGVLACWFQKTGSASPTYDVSVVPATNKINGIVHSMADGLIRPSAPITGMVVAWVY